MRIISKNNLAGWSLPAALLLFASAANAQGTPAKASVPAGNAAHGKQIYKTYGCYECHGYAGQGGAAGAKIAPNPISYALFSKYIRTPTGEMPPYTATVLPDTELADIYAFLLTIPKPPDPKTIPLLNQEK